jgi:DNA-binding transcriptional MerR regulator
MPTTSSATSAGTATRPTATSARAAARRSTCSTTARSPSPAIDPLQDAPGIDDDLVVPSANSPRSGRADRPGRRPGRRCASRSTATSPGSAATPTARSPRRHHRVAAPRRGQRTAEGYVVADSGSLNGTYVNQERVERGGPAPRRRAPDRQVPARLLRADRCLRSTDTGYLSIGEVLGLLLEEFPDVTISKIRFLESQGLISPERTAVGYRKFYDADVELLRVILTEQRENYLPLRVIKDRLDSGEIDPTGEHLRPNDDVHRRRRSATSTVTHHPRPATFGVDAPELDHTRPTWRRGDPLTPAAVVPNVHEPRPPAGGPPSAGPRRRPAPCDRPPVDGPAAPGVLLDRDELCAMTGITSTSSRSSRASASSPRSPAGGTRLYGEDAVEIAKPACEFLRPGVDARHLRLAHAAEREASLYEQLVTPRSPPAEPRVARRGPRPAPPLDALGRESAAALTRRRCATTSRPSTAEPTGRGPPRGSLLSVTPMELVGVRVEIPANTPMVLLRSPRDASACCRSTSATRGLLDPLRPRGGRPAPPAHPRSVRPVLEAARRPSSTRSSSPRCATTPTTPSCTSPRRPVRRSSPAGRPTRSPSPCGAVPRSSPPTSSSTRSARSPAPEPEDEAAEIIDEFKDFIETRQPRGLRELLDGSH